MEVNSSGITMEILNSDYDWRLIAEITASVLLLILITRVWLRRRKPLAQIARIVRKSSVEIHSPVVMPGVDGLQYTADYLVMTSCGIWLLDVLDFEGMIFGGAQTDEWTQVIGRKSFRFANPLYALRDKRLALQAMTDLGEIKAAVIFSRAGSFPKDRPEGIVQQQDLLQHLVCPDLNRKKQQDIHMQRAWDLLVTELKMS